MFINPSLYIIFVKAKKALLPLLIAFFFLVSGCSTQPKVCFDNGDCVDVELAITPEERATGLMYRTSLDVDKGMLFIYERPGRLKFWMKNTLIPLDMIFLNKDKDVVHIEHDVPPCKEDPCMSYGPPEKFSQYVLEVAAGVSNEQEISIGDKLTFVN